MTKENITTGLKITREQMIQLLNEDLESEYQAIIEVDPNVWTTKRRN
jgi:hypothetical protein